MKTKLELQADELWQTHPVGEETTPGEKFWKRYEKLIRASQKVIVKLPVVTQVQTLDTLTAYEQLPQYYYDDLFKKDKVFSKSSLLGSLALSLNAFNLIPYAGFGGMLAAFGGCFLLRYGYLSIFKSGHKFSLDIQPYFLQLGYKNKKRKVMLTHITEFSVEIDTIKITTEVPKKGERVRKKQYYIPFVKAKNERLSDDEITAICQLLSAVINENETKNNKE